MSESFKFIDGCEESKFKVSVLSHLSHFVRRWIHGQGDFPNDVWRLHCTWLTEWSQLVVLDAIQFHAYVTAFISRVVADLSIEDPADYLTQVVAFLVVATAERKCLTDVKSLFVIAGPEFTLLASIFPLTAVHNEASSFRVVVPFVSYNPTPYSEKAVIQILPNLKLALVRVVASWRRRVQQWPLALDTALMEIKDAVFDVLVEEGFSGFLPSDRTQCELVMNAFLSTWCGSFVYDEQFVEALGGQAVSQLMAFPRRVPVTTSAVQEFISHEVLHAAIVGSSKLFPNMQRGFFIAATEVLCSGHVCDFQAAERLLTNAGFTCLAETKREEVEPWVRELSQGSEYRDWFFSGKADLKILDKEMRAMWQDRLGWNIPLIRLRCIAIEATYDVWGVVQRLGRRLTNVEGELAMLRICEAVSAAYVVMGEPAIMVDEMFRFLYTLKHDVLGGVMKFAVVEEVNMEARPTLADMKDRARRLWADQKELFGSARLMQGGYNELDYAVIAAYLKCLTTKSSYAEADKVYRGRISAMSTRLRNFKPGFALEPEDFVDILKDPEIIKLPNATLMSLVTPSVTPHTTHVGAKRRASHELEHILGAHFSNWKLLRLTGLFSNGLPLILVKCLYVDLEGWMRARPCGFVDDYGADLDAISARVRAVANGIFACEITTASLGDLLGHLLAVGQHVPQGIDAFPRQLRVTADSLGEVWPFCNTTEAHSRRAPKAKELVNWGVVVTESKDGDFKSSLKVIATRHQNRIWFIQGSAESPPKISFFAIRNLCADLTSLFFSHRVKIVSRDKMACRLFRWWLTGISAPDESEKRLLDDNTLSFFTTVLTAPSRISSQSSPVFEMKTCTEELVQDVVQAVRETTAPVLASMGVTYLFRRLEGHAPTSSETLKASWKSQIAAFIGGHATDSHEVREGILRIDAYVSCEVIEVGEYPKGHPRDTPPTEERVFQIESNGLIGEEFRVREFLCKVEKTLVDGVYDWSSEHAGLIPFQKAVEVMERVRMLKESSGLEVSAQSGFVAFVKRELERPCVVTFGSQNGLVVARELLALMAVPEIEKEKTRNKAIKAAKRKLSTWFCSEPIGGPALQMPVSDAAGVDVDTHDPKTSESHHSTIAEPVPATAQPVSPSEDLEKDSIAELLKTDPMLAPDPLPLVTEASSAATNLRRLTYREYGFSVQSDMAAGSLLAIFGAVFEAHTSRWARRRLPQAWEVVDALCRDLQVDSVKHKLQVEDAALFGISIEEALPKKCLSNLKSSGLLSKATFTSLLCEYVVEMVQVRAAVKALDVLKAKLLKLEVFTDKKIHVVPESIDLGFTPLNSTDDIEETLVIEVTNFVIGQVREIVNLDNQVQQLVNSLQVFLGTKVKVNSVDAFTEFISPFIALALRRAVDSPHLDAFIVTTLETLPRVLTADVSTFDGSRPEIFLEWLDLTMKKIPISTMNTEHAVDVLLSSSPLLTPDPSDPQRSPAEQFRGMLEYLQSRFVTDGAAVYILRELEGERGPDRRQRLLRVKRSFIDPPDREMTKIYSYISGLCDPGLGKALLLFGDTSFVIFKARLLAFTS